MTIASCTAATIGDVIARRKSQVVGWAERVALALLAAYLCFHTLPRAFSKLNTDFPNYYISARLAREGVDSARMYEWLWLQREKDHRGFDLRIIGLLPITPFSTLAMWPLAELPPLAAKRIWIIVNLLSLGPLVWLLHSLTGLSRQRVALVLALSFPLHRNLLYGQFYVVLLLLIAAACWAYLRDKPGLSGSLVALAAACKLFPAIFVVFFLRRRDWRSLASAALTGAGCVAVSVAVFGWNVHRTYLREIIPWTMRGEALPPYATMSASLSSVLHYLFLPEPQWNPHPWHDSPLFYALLLPMLQVAAVAPAILLIRREDRSRRGILLEWSALLTASLAASPIPASYNSVLLAFPVCVLAQVFLERRQFVRLSLLAFAYVGIGFPMPSPARYVGPAILLYVPRLILTLALLVAIYLQLWHDRAEHRPSWKWSGFAWAGALVGLAVFSVVSILRQQIEVRREYAFRVPMPVQDFIEAEPKSIAGKLLYIEFSPTGYRLVSRDRRPMLPDPAFEDTLSFSGPGRVWVEEAAYSESKLVDLANPSWAGVPDALDPMPSADGQAIAFIHNALGSGRLMMMGTSHLNPQLATPVTPPSLNVYEASFLSPHLYAFSASENGRPPSIYLTDQNHLNAPLALGESRYPALSPDGRWLVYSRFERGSWNLWLRDEISGAARRIADVPCNQIQPSWEEDSRTILYSTDCGRSLWFTAIARRRIIP